MIAVHMGVVAFLGKQLWADHELLRETMGQVQKISEIRAADLRSMDEMKSDIREVRALIEQRLLNQLHHP